MGTIARTRKITNSKTMDAFTLQDTDIEDEVQWQILARIVCKLVLLYKNTPNYELLSFFKL